jgi:hypothetical protein
LEEEASAFIDVPIGTMHPKDLFLKSKDLLLDLLDPEKITSCGCTRQRNCSIGCWRRSALSTMMHPDQPFS